MLPEVFKRQQKQRFRFFLWFSAVLFIAGVMLVQAAKNMNYKDCSESFFVGQDLDGTCVKMCGLNLLFFNLDGYAIKGNSLAMEMNWGYRTIRSVYGGSIREMTEKELEQMKPKIKEAMEQASLPI